ncbi:MAG: GIY-YIG nuclease family protein, partial [Candidatus Aerophobetes bacterium]|nr:GIY-YIG nuclease family protein [Candidatus Aerophobetes bacterium]
MNIYGKNKKQLLYKEHDIVGSIICHNIPEEPGVYLICDTSSNVLYVGSSDCLRRRIAYLEAHVYDSSSGKYIHNASDCLIKLQDKGKDIIVHHILCKDYK